MRHPALEYLRKIRRNKWGFSQKQFAGYLGISRSYYSLIEEGRRRLPKEIKKRIELYISPNELKEWETLLGKSERDEKKYQDFIIMLTEFYDDLPDGAHERVIEKVKIFMEGRKRK